MTILTDEEIAVIVREAAKGSATRRDGTTSTRIARAIEAKILEKLNSQEPVAWQIRNGVCHAGIRSNKNDAESAAANMQKCADLGGSLCYYHVRPLYAHPMPQELIEKVEKLTIERCAVACDLIDGGWHGDDSDVWACMRSIRNLPTGQIKLEELK